MKDPLAGKREAINRGQLRVLCFPGDRPCSVEKGQVFKLRSCAIRIEGVGRHLSRGSYEWRANFVRLSSEDGFFLGTATVNEARSLQHGSHWGYTEEHGYTSSQDTLKAGACVPPDHQRRLSKEAAVRGEVQRRLQRARSEKVAVEAQLAKSRHRPNAVRALNAKRERAERRLSRAA